MLEIVADIWTAPDGVYRCVTTNGIVMKNGKCVMGAGIAKQVRDTYHDFDLALGSRITHGGNHVYLFNDVKWLSFPTKHDWKNPSDIDLICQSAVELSNMSIYLDLPVVWLPRPGCSNGLLSWDFVKEKISPLLCDRIVIISKGH